MKLHEHQAKTLMATYGILVPTGSVVTKPEEAQRLTENFGGMAVVKAQVHAGGRGKGGGVKVVRSGREAYEIAESLLGGKLVTPQTGPEGVPVNTLLVEEPVDILQEVYLAIIPDGGLRSNVIIASSSGGMEIEEVARTDPDKIIRCPVDPILGYQPFQGRNLAYSMGFSAELARSISDLIGRLYKLFVDKDCSLAEINPLVVTGDGRVMAVDGKLTIDDDALFRQKEMVQFADPTQEHKLETEAYEAKISYVQLDGNIGCLVNGAGLAMATMDIITTVGAAPANFLDVGGGADDEKVKRAFGIILSDKKVEKVLVNIFGGILRCDIVARGILASCAQENANPKMIVRMLGTNVDEGRKILQSSGLDVTLVDTLSEAAKALQAT